VTIASGVAQFDLVVFMLASIAARRFFIGAALLCIRAADPPSSGQSTARAPRAVLLVGGFLPCYVV
jgi:hypothetical protein